MSKYVYELKQKSLHDIHPKLIEIAIGRALLNGTIFRAPLGSSGEDIILFGNVLTEPRFSRQSLVSFRLHNTSVEMLITNYDGLFLFYGKFDQIWGVENIARWYYDIFMKCQSKILP